MIFVFAETAQYTEEPAFVSRVESRGFFLEC